MLSVMIEIMSYILMNYMTYFDLLLIIEPRKTRVTKILTIVNILFLIDTTVQTYVKYNIIVLQ